MTHTNMMLAPSRKTVYHVVPNNGLPVQPTIRRAVYNRFVGWIATASLSAIGKTLGALGTLAAVSLLAWKPHLAWSLFLLCLRSVSYKVPLVLGASLLLLHARRIGRWCGRLRSRRPARPPTDNQYTFEGLPVGELAAYLKQTGAWKHDESVEDLAISHGQWERVGEALEKHGILVRGANNARVLRDIGYTHLVMQLRALAKGLTPPLMWDELNGCWTETDGPWGRHLQEEPFKRRKAAEETARVERKAERAKKQLERRREELAALPAVQVSPAASDAFSAIMSMPA